MLDNAFEALKKYDWGSDRAAVDPIADAVAATHNDAPGRRDLEARLVKALAEGLSRDAKEYVCRMLSVAGSAVCVPALAGMLGDEKLSHGARIALERINIPEAARALRDALGSTSGQQRIGVIGSLGSRKDKEAAPLIAALLKDSDPATARAAAAALGQIGTADAVTALKAKVGAKDLGNSVVDALLACAESLLAAGEIVVARQLYDSLASEGNHRLVRLAATRGQLACAAKVG